MMIYWSFNPILASIGPFSIHWYGVLFVGAFLMAKFVMARIFKAEDVPEELAERLFYFALVGGIVGARLAHCLFYDPAHYLSHPMEILRVWEGGLASHGGMAGILIALWLGTRGMDRTLPFLWLIDRASIPAALGAVFVRVANFLNS
ncbi:Prolipoprotein diacylglyceryl transferase [compost metagenome]